ncbi:Immunoglobulin I-set domain [Popillia japonica]|uniref:Immunoglobulin I-set domain n=1 Tax=Popillia japonica TaxID=7064 RepID=A0AAW1LQ47_POPJA
MVICVALNHINLALISPYINIFNVLSGLPGPIGSKGKPGINGTAGDPGVCIYPMTDPTGKSNFTIRPSIATGSFSYSLIGPINVDEGDNVTFHCAASGTPKPIVTWKRLDNQPIIMGRRKDVLVEGYTLYLPVVNRDQMGTYQCIADNGIPPQANQTFHLEVQFHPSIRIRNLKIPTFNGSSATLECEVEAYPEAIRYWERGDGRLLENGEKYRIESTIDSKSNYKTKMKLTITRINRYDYTDYYCIAKNEKTYEPVRGQLTVYEADPDLPVPVAPSDSGGIWVGARPPDYVSYESICPPAPQCPECLNQQECKYLSLALLNLIQKWDVRPYRNVKYPGYPDRTTSKLFFLHNI